ncbi:MAG: L,D-transpeptidase family protein [Pseudomonadota bacterium]
MNASRMQHGLLGLLAFTLATAHAADYPQRPGDDVVGAQVLINASADETLLDIGRRFDLGYHDMAQANPSVDIWLPADGETVALPLHFVLPNAPRSGLVLNLPEFRLYHYPDGESGPVTTYPVSIGKMDWETPLGVTRVTAKARNPAWYPPQSVRDEHAADGDPLPRVVPPGPDNPLGTRAIRLALPGYLIHGTNRPAGVGMRVTHGCLRLFPEDIERLFENVPVGTAVRIVDQPVKAGWANGRLWLEVHPTLAQVGGGERQEPPPSLSTAATQALVAATDQRPATIDWALVEAAVVRSNGMPIVVGRAAVESP